MRNAPAFVSALLCALFMPLPGSVYFLAGASIIVFGPIAALYTARLVIWAFGHIFLAATSRAARVVVAIAGLSALGAGLASACAEPVLSRRDQVLEEYLANAVRLDELPEAERQEWRALMRPSIAAAKLCE